MRCLTLADELQVGGAAVCFVSRPLAPHLRAMLERRGHALVTLAEPESGPVLASALAHAHWLGCSQTDDAAATRAALSYRRWDWLVVDHYALDAEWERALRSSARRVAVIDDLADRDHDCDILLDQNFYAGLALRYTGKVPPHATLLLGPRYVLLRPEFRQGQARQRSGPVRRVLVFFGGVDQDNATATAIAALAMLDCRAFEVDIVIGAQHPFADQIAGACRSLGFELHVQTERMAALMVSADLAIGAGGAATWERCALGLPSIVLVLADNQRAAMVDLDAAGVVLNAGDVADVTAVQLAGVIGSVLGDEALRAGLSTSSLALMGAFTQDNLAQRMLRSSDEI